MPIFTVIVCDKPLEFLVDSNAGHFVIRSSELSTLAKINGWL